MASRDFDLIPGRTATTTLPVCPSFPSGWIDRGVSDGGVGRRCAGFGVPCCNRSPGPPGPRFGFQQEDVLVLPAEQPTQKSWSRRGSSPPTVT